MAKIATRDIFVRNPDGSIPSRNGAALKKRKTPARKLHSEVLLYRTGDTGGKSFQACVVIGKRLQGSPWQLGKGKRASGYTTSCMFGRNPRAALKAALARASRQMGKRSGAFARYGRK